MLSEYDFVLGSDEGTHDQFQNLAGTVAERNLSKVHTPAGRNRGFQGVAAAVRIAGDFR